MKFGGDNDVTRPVTESGVVQVRRSAMGIGCAGDINAICLGYFEGLIDIGAAWMFQVHPLS